MRTAFVRLSLLASLALLPGCVVWEIRDEMRSVNTRLDSVDASLADVTSELTSVNDELTDIEVQLGDVRSTIDGTNESLDDVQGGLGRTNNALSSVEEQLRLLRAIEASLSRLDTHLASLRKTINRIDGAIPFLSLGGDEVVETPAETPAPAPDDQAPALADAGDRAAETRATSPTPARRDPLVGVWITAQPDDGATLVLQPDGRYLLSTPVDGAPDRREQGAWTRVGDTLTLSPAAGATSAKRAWSIVLQTTRSLTIDNGSQIRVFVKP